MFLHRRGTFSCPGKALFLAQEMRFFLPRKGTFFSCQGKVIFSSPGEVLFLAQERYFFAAELVGVVHRSAQRLYTSETHSPKPRPRARRIASEARPPAYLGTLALQRATQTFFGESTPFVVGKADGGVFLTSERLLRWAIAPPPPPPVLAAKEKR